MDIPKSTQVYIDSLEPRWFYGVKSFSEPPLGGAGSDLERDFQCCGVRIREHPITRERLWPDSPDNARRRSRRQA